MESIKMLNDRNRKAAEKIKNLEKVIQDQKEKIDSLEKSRSQSIQQRNELEDKEFYLENRLKQTEARFQAVDEQLTLTIKENESLQRKQLNS